MKHIFYTFLISLMLLSCSDRQEQYVIAFSQCSSDMWRDKLNEEMLTSTYLYGNRVKLKIATAYDSSQRQMEQIDRFVEEGVDMLIVSPNQTSAITGAIDRAYDKGIPVILFDRKTNSDKYTAFIGADNVEVGRAMGEHMARLMQGRGTMVEIKGLRGSSPSEERHAGLVKALARYPGIRLVDGGYGTWQEPSGRDAMRHVLDNERQISCVLSQNDPMASGAYKEARRRGRAQGVLFAGVDALPDKGGGMEMVRNGQLEATYVYPTRGDLVMQLAMNILDKKPFRRDNLMKGAIVTRDNVDVMMLQAEEMKVQQERLHKLHRQEAVYLSKYNAQRVYFFLSLIILVLCVASFVIVYRSVTLKRRMVERMAKDRLTFFTNVSHELRTPLTLIAAPLERLLADGSIGQKPMAMLKMMMKNVNLLLFLIDETLDLRKMQNGKMTTTPTLFSLTAAIASWTDNFKPIAQGKGIDLGMSIAPDVMVNTDIYMLERVCYNLLSNALKYTPKGGSVSVSMQPGSSGLVRIEVSDTGVGISRSQQEHVFDRFYQAGGNSTGSTGLGLAIVKQYVEVLQGTVSVHSRQGHGTTFAVSLPQGDITAGSPHTAGVQLSTISIIDDGDVATLHKMPGEKCADAITSPTGQRFEAAPLVLVVEDNADVRSLIVTLLDDICNVVQAENGSDGLDKAMRQVPDLIISDVMMPVMDGMEMCRRLKAETATSHIPVLLLTARSKDDGRVEGYRCGADAYLAKPFSGEVLVARVNNLLENRRKLKQAFASDGVPEASGGGVDAEFINAFHKIVRERMGDSDLSVEAVSAELGLSRVQMYRKIKAMTGTTPVELIRVARLRRGRHLLATTGKTVSEVCYEVGFSSPSYFTKCYKEYFGQTPHGK